MKHKMVYFQVYYDTFKHIERLSMEERGKLFTALYKYASEGEYTEQENPATDMALSFMAAQIDRDIESYEEKCRINSINGKKGGAPKGSRNAAKINRTVNLKTELTQEEEKEEYKEKDNEYEKDNEEEYEEYSSVPSSEDDVGADQTDFVVGLFNNICTSLPRVEKLTDKRRQAVKNAEKHLSGGEFEELFRRVEASDFLTGRSSDWSCGFDWILKPENIQKILEGTYANKVPPKRRSACGFDYDELERIV